MTGEIPPRSEIILYQTEDGRTRIQCRFEDQTVWLTQKLMAELFQIGVGTVNHHLKAIFAEGELHPEATIRRYRIVQIEGERQVTREIEHYSLEAILSVGYRVRSHRGTQFRQWATARLFQKFQSWEKNLGKSSNGWGFWREMPPVLRLARRLALPRAFQMRRRASRRAVHFFQPLSCAKLLTQP